MGATGYLKRQSEPPHITLGLFLLLLLGVADYLTGAELSISIFYLFPILLMVWFINRRAGVFFSILSSAIGLTTDLMVGYTYSHAIMVYWNNAIQMGFFLIIVFILSAFKKEYQKTSKLNIDLQDAFADIKRLQGLLPICASCKKIRDDKGYWNHIETYIQEHSEAEFTHGICPDCMKKLYGASLDEDTDPKKQ